MEFRKRKLFTVSVTLKMTIQNYFSIKRKKKSNKFANKIGKNCQKNKLKINFFLTNILKNGHLEGKAYCESKKCWDRALKNIGLNFSGLSSGLFPKKQVIWTTHCVANVYAVLPFYNVKCLCSGGREWGREESHSH